MILSSLRTLTRHYPFQQPRASLLSILPDVPSDFGAFEAKNGIKYIGYPCGQDYIIKNLFWFGDFEPWITSMIRYLVRPGEIVCDIGANIGDTAFQILPYLGSSGHIYCFEPVPILQVCLTENLKANNVSCITLVPKALSNSSGQLMMTVQGTHFGGAYIIKDDNNHNSINEKIEIEVTTFDLWLKDNSISQVAVCKVDVEGHELEVFEGMKNSLDAGRVGSIVFERHHDCNSSDPVVKLLYDHHYRIFRIYKSFLKIEALELFNDRTYLRGTADYVAVLEGSIFEKRLNHLTRC
ncbi:FkbM family methyltransferase [Dolichospermum sp. UHCC 0352]|jgi:FkbM family methyltransferase|uniref:FkbM family methyltransferase n=1 Tax=Dolichospermum sp. UHCC 0352 TaxID=2590011 RepID=UPI0014457D33|nr:FkbM family methyltransferase [Dolichospermum sp. UHCC 0352]MBO1053608.1 FkbM family methyltransferase [Dolichospermum sp. DET73]MTJ23038.1 FkbM family methyltransferase [Dolichospermum sp. UHCC 0352]